MKIDIPIIFDNNEINYNKSMNAYEEIKEADNIWLQWMSNKSVYAELITTIIFDTDYKYLGSAYIAGNEDIVIAISTIEQNLLNKAVHDPFNHDIIYTSNILDNKDNIELLSKKRNKKNYSDITISYNHFEPTKNYNPELQYIYGLDVVNISVEKKYQSYFEHPTKDLKKDEKGVIFFGNAIQIENDQELLVHWIACIIDTEKNKVFWYDPALDYSFNINLLDYSNFPLWKKDWILYCIREKYGDDIELVDICSNNKAQQVCSVEELDNDIFCQTWVLMFVDAYTHNMWEQMNLLRYEIYGSKILKEWLFALYRFINFPRDLEIFLKDKDNMFCYTLHKEEYNEEDNEEYKYYASKVSNYIDIPFRNMIFYSLYHFYGK